MISYDLRFSEHWISREKRAETAWFNKTTVSVQMFHNSLVGPHLKYAAKFLSPTLGKDLKFSERAQVQGAELIFSFRHRGYEHRLQEWDRQASRPVSWSFKFWTDLNTLTTESHSNCENQAPANGWKVDLPRFHTSWCGNFWSYEEWWIFFQHCQHYNSWDVKIQSRQNTARNSSVSQWQIESSV